MKTIDEPPAILNRTSAELTRLLQGDRVVMTYDELRQMARHGINYAIQARMDEHPSIGINEPAEEAEEDVIEAPLSMEPLTEIEVRL